jgi:hypothetical protein
MSRGQDQRFIYDTTGHMDALCLEFTTLSGRREIAAAAVAHLLVWLGCLRSLKRFSLTWGDMKLTRPEDGPVLVGLAKGIGVIELWLLAETKSNIMPTLVLWSDSGFVD